MKAAGRKIVACKRSEAMCFSIAHLLWKWGTPLRRSTPPAEHCTKCRTPLSFARLASLFPCRSSPAGPIFMGDWTDRTPPAPSSANRRECSLSRLPWASSTPCFARATAFGDRGSRTSARTCQCPRRRISRIVAPPCCPVAPVIRITGFDISAPLLERHNKPFPLDKADAAS